MDASAWRPDSRAARGFGLRETVYRINSCTMFLLTRDPLRPIIFTKVTHTIPFYISSHHNTPQVWLICAK